MMIERIVYANEDNCDFPIRIGSGPDSLAYPEKDVCIDFEGTLIYVDKKQWPFLKKAIDQWFEDNE
jgi:hypothetical protein